MIAHLLQKSNPFFKKSRGCRPLFGRLFSSVDPLFTGDLPLWKTTLSPVDFSTRISKSFPQPVENSVDISAIFWNFPHKIRHFGCFSRLKSNFGVVDNYQTRINRVGVFHREGKRSRGIFGDLTAKKGAKNRSFFRMVLEGEITGNK